MALPSGIHPRTGKLGRVRWQGVVLRLKLWRVNPEATDHDVTHFEAGGFGEGVNDIISATGSASGDYDAGANPFDSPLAIFPGAVMVNAYFYISTIDGTAWNFPQIRIIGHPMTHQIKGVCSIEFNWASNGPFYAPTGSF